MFVLLRAEADGLPLPVGEEEVPLLRPAVAALARLTADHVDAGIRLAGVHVRLGDWASQLPFSQEYSYLNGDLDDEFYREGIYVGYRFFDSFSVEPAFPFGYGLSYTDFAMRCAGIRISEDGRRVTVEAAVANIGETYTGKEVAQL